MRKWIRTDKELPPKNTEVWCTIAGSDIVCPKEGETIPECMNRQHKQMRRVKIGYLSNDGWCDTDGWPMIVHPIAWMPIDKPKAYRGQMELYTPEEMKVLNEAFEKRMRDIWNGDDNDDEDMI